MEINRKVFTTHQQLVLKGGPESAFGSSKRFLDLSSYSTDSADHSTFKFGHF